MECVFCFEKYSTDDLYGHYQRHLHVILHCNICNKDFKNIENFFCHNKTHAIKKNVDDWKNIFPINYWIESLVEKQIEKPIFISKFANWYFQKQEYIPINKLLHRFLNCDSFVCRICSTKNGKDYVETFFFSNRSFEHLHKEHKLNFRKSFNLFLKYFYLVERNNGKIENFIASLCSKIENDIKILKVTEQYQLNSSEKELHLVV